MTPRTTRHRVTELTTLLTLLAGLWVFQIGRVLLVLVQ